MSSRIRRYQDKVLGLLAGKAEGFYLVGGTALALYYFNHRESFDLDFFTQDFNRSRISRIMGELASNLNKKVDLVAEQNKKDMVKIAIYMVNFSSRDSLKIDFVQDAYKLIKQPKIVNDIAVSSLEDIYFRKINAIAGDVETLDIIGAKMTVGGRQEAKDFYDLYCLSSTFTPLYRFAEKYCDPVRKEALIRWFRIYDRMQIRTGLLELKTDKMLDYKLMESHFKKQIDKLIDAEVGL